MEISISYPINNVARFQMPGEISVDCYISPCFQGSKVRNSAGEEGFIFVYEVAFKPGHQSPSIPNWQQSSVVNCDDISALPAC